MKFKVYFEEETKPVIFYVMEEGYITLDKIVEIQREIAFQLYKEIKEAYETDKILIIEPSYTEPEYLEEDSGEITVLDGYWDLEVVGEEKIIREPMPF